MAEAAANEDWKALHEANQYHDGTLSKWSKDRSPQFPFHRDDGVTIWVSRRDLNPDDDFLT